MTQTNQAPRIIRTLVWPAVVLVALVLFRTQLAAFLPGVKHVKVGGFEVQAGTPLAEKADSVVPAAVSGLTDESHFTLMSRSLGVTCFTPPLDLAPLKAQHSQLFEKGLMSEIPAAELGQACAQTRGSIYGLRVTTLGKQARDLQLMVLRELSKASVAKAP